MAKISKCGYEILTPLDPEIGMNILKHIERVARTCYKSETAITEQSSANMVKRLIANKHFAMLEHFNISVKFITDRGVSHEIVRHRIASYAQESTRYCNYGSDKFNNEITVISPLSAMELKAPDGADIGEWYDLWVEAVCDAENKYLRLVELGCPPEIARGVLPTSLKTEIVVTMNLREWRHFFELRVLGTTGKPHPQIYELTKPMLFKLNSYIPVVFEDLVERFKKVNPYADKSAMQSAGAEVLRSATE